VKMFIILFENNISKTFKQKLLFLKSVF